MSTTANEQPAATSEEAEAALTPREWGSKPWKRPFLVALARTGNYAAACRHVQRSYTYAMDEKKDDPEFGSACREAELVHADFLEQVAWRLATVGEQQRTVTTTTKRDSSGEVVEESTTVKEGLRRSDRLLERMLVAHKPHKYGDRTTISGDPDSPLQVEIGPRVLTDEMLAKVAEGMMETGLLGSGSENGG